MNEIREATFDELSLGRLYQILRLRVAVFIVEQECPYMEIDNLDVEAAHLWIDDEQGLASYLRVIKEENGCRIGRVVTRIDARSRGLSRKLIDHVIDSKDGPWVLSAQAHLGDWYQSLGFNQNGPEFLEDGIPHIPMLREVEDTRKT